MSRIIVFSLVITCIILFLKKDNLSLDNENNIRSGSISDLLHFNTTKTEKNKDLFQQKVIPEEEHSSKEALVVPKYKSGEFQAGMNLLVYGHPDISEAERIFSNLNQLGVNSITITFPFNQTDWQANHVMNSSLITPTMSELEGLIKEAHTFDLMVMLRPILDEKNLMKDGFWRGEIQPSNPKAWFNSFRKLLLPYAELAQSNNVQIFNFGTEFNSLQNKYSDEWIKLIEELRNVYKGDLIYSFNWDTYQDIPKIEFVKLLDHVGLDAYFPLNAPDGASVERLEAEWKKWLDDFNARVKHESIIITEAGIIPAAGAYRTPYSWEIPDAKLDWQAQANYYKATFKVWKPIIKGLYWWGVTLDHNIGTIDYSPLNSPTEAVIKQQYLHPPQKDEFFLKTISSSP